MSYGSNIWQFTYDADGLRTKRVNGSTSYTYEYADGLLARMYYNSQLLFFTYGANGRPLGVNYDGSQYYYDLNLQGDVVGIRDNTGTAVVTYTYDAWGRLLSTSGTMVSTLGLYNPLRYRSYVYDRETELYYLQSRYYDPMVGRFISADDIDLLGANGDVLSYNLFAYCGNNPVVRQDPSGHAFETVFDIISLASSVAAVVANPADPWAWAGLVGDVIDVAVPFLTGVGEATKAISTTVRVISNVDDVADTAKAFRRTAEVADDVKGTVGTYVVLYKNGNNYVGKGPFYRAIRSAEEHVAAGEKITSIVWAPASTDTNAFIAEYLLQTIRNVGKDGCKTFNRIWSPGRMLF